MQQGIGVREKEAVVLPVQRAHFFIYMVQKLQLVEMLQGKPATVYNPAFLRAQPFRILQKGEQALFGQVNDVVLA